MAISVNWITKVITVPRTDMALVQSVPTEIRSLDINAFRLELKDLEDDEGMPFETTHRHNTTVTVGGVELARVVEIINGYTVTFEDGQYAVNLSGANSNISDVTNVNQVSVRSANSAGLTFSDEINKQAFVGAKVYINTSGKGTAGFVFPQGTPSDPVDNYDDAVIVSTNNKFSSFNLDGELTLDVSHSVENTNWDASSPLKSKLIFSNQNTSRSCYSRITLEGDLSGSITADECLLTDITDFGGIALNSGIAGTIGLESTYNNTIMFNNCNSSIAGSSRPILDCNNTTADIQFRKYSGGLTVQNFTSGNSMSLDLISGVVELDSSCTSGTIVVRGVCRLIDNSGAGCTVITDELVENLVPSSIDIVNQIQTELSTELANLDAPISLTATQSSVDALETIVNGIATDVVEIDSDITVMLQVLDTLRKYETNRYKIDIVAKTLTIYDDDDVTPILVFNLLDENGIPSTDKVLERVPA